MRSIIGLLTCLFGCECPQAWATDPAPAAPAQVEPGQAPAPLESAAKASSATPPTSSAPVKAAVARPTSSAPPDVSAEDDKRLRAAGYKPGVLNGTTYYCKNEVVIGTRFEHKVCRTPDQMAVDRYKGRDETEKSQIRTYNGPGT